MDDGFKLSFVPNVEERIEIVLNSLNNGTNIQDTNATEVLKLFEPDAIAYEEYFKNNPNSKYTFKEFAIFYAIDKGNYINYFCHTYLALIPKGFETFLEGLDFYSFADDADYEKFVSMNAQKYYEQRMFKDLLKIWLLKGKYYCYFILLIFIIKELMVNI